MNPEAVFQNLDKPFLLNSLDAMQNAISIYDEKRRLLYANENYCRNMFIEDRESVVGQTIEETMKRYGTKVFALQANKEYLAMPDVLKYGKRVMDWEVKVFKEEEPDISRMLVFDMYPIFDQEGSVKGVIEVSHSRNTDLRRVKRMVGLTAEYTFDSILGESEAIRSKIWQAARFAESGFNLHIYGESGVGKELFAQAVHNASSSRKGPFVALNCASFPENLIESELFGYVAGAFTGASKNGQISKFELADGGTLFLDEIGDMPLPFQAKLLRVLETGTVTRIGSSTSIPFHVRIISATNRDLEKMVKEGAFRRDLYYRLQVLSLEIPPLRERECDTIIIANRFLEQISERTGERTKRFSPAAEEEMLRYEWPGNVRELKNVMNRISVLAKGETIGLADLKPAVGAKMNMEQAPGIYGSLAAKEKDAVMTPRERIDEKRKAVEQVNRSLILEALEIAEGDKKAAAELLGVSRKTMYNMMHRYHLEI